MPRLRTIAVLAILAILVSTAAAVGYASSDAAPAGDTKATTGKIDLAFPGTAWVIERPTKVAQRYFAWGLRVRHKTGGNEWFHMPLALPTVVDGTAMKISLVEFCAKSTGPTVVKPVTIHLYENNRRFHSSAISWPNSTGIHCHSVGFNPPVWKQTVGMSVEVSFGNTSDSLTFYKGWVRVVP